MSLSSPARPATSQATTSVSVPFVDLQAQFMQVQPEIEAAVIETLRRGDYVGGSAVTRFEEAFADYCGTDYAVGVANGTDALELALTALGIGPGCEVITVATTFMATVEAILNVGATPRFVDVEPATGNMDASLIESAITERTKAVIAVHLYGRCADIDAIKAVTDRCRLPLIEDAAQAQGATYKGKRAGSMGDIACFSFYPSKNLGALGDAGAITTNSADFAQQIRAVANHGSVVRYQHDRNGRNSRMDTIQAVALQIKLRHLDRWNESRREVATEYHRLLSSVSSVRLPARDDNAFVSVQHIFAIRVPNRDAVALALKAKGINAAVHYPIGAHRQLATAHLPAVQLPHTEDWADNELSLPMFESMSGRQILLVAEALS